MDQLKSSDPKQTPLLGDFHYQRQLFEGLDALFAQFRESFKKLIKREQFHEVNVHLLRLIQEAPEPCFLLPAVLHYIDCINREGLLFAPYHFSRFEFWLNRLSGLDPEANSRIRGKIVGKYLPREEYSRFFPIGTGRVYQGAHFVVAHLSPDMDTTVASFIGWLDAFGAQVASSQHYWALPGGPSDSHIRRVFDQFFGDEIFRYLARQSPSLTLAALDLMEQQRLHREPSDSLLGQLQSKLKGKAVVCVDQEGRYLGDWRESDLEPVRSVLTLFEGCLHWFQRQLQAKLIRLFAQSQLSTEDLSLFVPSILGMTLEESDPFQEYQPVQKRQLGDFITSVLGVADGLSASLSTLLDAFQRVPIKEVGEFRDRLASLSSCGLFDAEGHLVAERSVLFRELGRIVDGLDCAVAKIGDYLGRLEVGIKVKTAVLHRAPQYAFIHEEVEELRQKMEADFLTIVLPEDDGRLLPIGLVEHQCLCQEKLGTASQRDFCNLNETKMASYLEVISVVDHHKTNLSTNLVPQVTIGDVQSSNVLVAELQFQINDRYSSNGMTEQQVDEQIAELSTGGGEPSELRVLQRLFKRKLAIQRRRGRFVDPAREFMEYLYFLYAILDDTDLLNKVTSRDVEVVCELLNRLKSLSEGRECEVIDLESIPRDRQFAKAAAKAILQHPEMYSVYASIYRFKEEEVAANLDLCAQGLDSNLFSDTKEQNGCCRVGQTKLFALNFPPFQKVAQKLRKRWVEGAKQIYASRPEINLHLHMVSTIPSADEMYQGHTAKDTHCDEIWLWVPPTADGYDRLSRFLHGMQNCPEFKKSSLALEVEGPHADTLAQIFAQSLPNLSKSAIGGQQEGLSLAILRFEPGLLNSRKTQITPYLPKPVG